MTLYRAAVKTTHPILGGTGVNTWHMRTTGDDPDEPSSEAEGLMGLVEDFYSAVATFMPEDTDIDWDGSYIAFQAGNIEQHAEPWHVDGGSTTAPLPPANCICVGWRTSIATRRGRGRTFLNPLTLDTAQSDGTITPGALTGIRDAAAALVDDSKAFTNGALGVWSDRGNVFHDFTASAVRDMFAVLRSRRD